MSARLDRIADAWEEDTMIDRQHGAVIFECDNCSEVLETGEDDFMAALAVMRRENWKAVKVGDDWVHSCPECRSDGGYQERSSKGDFRRG